MEADQAHLGPPFKTQSLRPHTLHHILNSPAVAKPFLAIHTPADAHPNANPPLSLDASGIPLTPERPIRI